MKQFWVYFKTVCRHKWFVAVEGVKLGVPLWMLILHDWDKFMPRMFGAYADSFYNKEGEKRPYNPDAESEEFLITWNRHQKINRHHWQAHVCRMDDGREIAMPMDDVDIREMVADWRGAGRAYGNSDTKGWYLKRQGTSQLILNAETKEKVEFYLGIST